MPTFTTEDLLVYMYNEMSADKAADLEQALKTDWALQQKYSVLAEAQSMLNHTKLSSPRSNTIDSILRYAGSKLHYSN